MKPIGSGPPKKDASSGKKRRAQVQPATKIVASPEKASAHSSSAHPNDIVAELRSLLGDDVVLLPIRRRGKNPVNKDWQFTKLSKMREPEYLAQLNHGRNIGVLLGNGRITIDLDRDEAVEPFLKLNPKLRNTLRTRRARGCNFWLRIEGECPDSCKLKTKTDEDWGELRAAGNQTIIYGEAIDRNKRETQPIPYKILNRTAPIKIRFDEIRFPDELVQPWMGQSVSGAISRNWDDLRRLYGEPFYRDEHGNPCLLNESFWAGVFASENIVLWEPSERAFYSYRAESGIYTEESADVIKRRISDRLLDASRQMNCFWLEKQRSDARLNSIVAHLRGILEKRDAFFQRERRIHLANGVFSFENGGELLAFSPTFVSRNRSPIVFDENAKCDRFLDELVYPAVHTDDVVLIQKYFGLCLLGTNIIQRLLILDGESARGKTQLANVAQAIVGRENVTQLRTKWLAERFETYRFLKKTLLIGVDVEPNFLSTTGAAILKGLIGGDWFDAEQKLGTGSFQFQGNFCAIVTSNARLRVRLCGDVAAWRRRLLIVRYEGPPPRKKIPDFGTLLAREEGSGILNWSIAGLHLLLQDIDQSVDGDISLTDRQKSIVDSLLAESDSLRFFLRQRVENAPDADLSVNEIVEAYAAFCPEMGWKPLPITEIHDALEGLMLELFQVTKAHCIKREGKSVRGFFGVTFTT